jgi:hypothetical protein
VFLIVYKSSFYIKGIVAHLTYISRQTPPHSRFALLPGILILPPLLNSFLHFVAPLRRDPDKARTEKQ